LNLFCIFAAKWGFTNSSWGSGTLKSFSKIQVKTKRLLYFDELMYFDDDERRITSGDYPKAVYTIARNL
jgi:hypothetical protein